MEQNRVARKSCFYALLLAFFFLLFGTLLLRLFGVSLSMIRVVGGIILTRIGFQMFSPSPQAKASAGSGSGADLRRVTEHHGSQAATPKRAPTPAVKAIANAPQKVTRDDRRNHGCAPCACSQKAQQCQKEQ